MRVHSIQAGDLVEATGRLFTADGLTFIRPRQDPAEPNTPEAAQARLDSTKSRVQVVNTDRNSVGSPVQNGRWVTLWGTYREDAIDALGFAPAEAFDDNWSSHPSFQSAPESDRAIAWRLSEDERLHREWMMEEVKEHFDQWQIWTVGLSGTSAGSFAVSLYVLRVNEGLAKWASDFSDDQLIIRSFLRSSKRL